MRRRAFNVELRAFVGELVSSTSDLIHIVGGAVNVNVCSSSKTKVSVAVFKLRWPKCRPTNSSALALLRSFNWVAAVTIATSAAG
jgi:hypothetical protein